MKFQVILEGLGGELAREEFDVKADGEIEIEDQVNALASEAIEGFVLSVGDVIRIVEVE